MTTSDKFRHQEARLDADIQQALEAIRQPLLERAGAIVAAQREMKRELDQDLRTGSEKKALESTLAAMRLHAERGTKFLGRAAAIFESDPAAMSAMTRYLHEAEQTLGFLRDLETRLSASTRPFDESVLNPASDGPVATGYVSAREARARVAGQK
jgi:hypothetical protein